MLYFLDVESEFIPNVAKLRPSFRQLEGLYRKLKAITHNQAEYDQLNDEWTLVTERLSNVQAEIGAHPVLSNSELKQNWQNLLEAERQLQYRYSELRREVNRDTAGSYPTSRKRSSRPSSSSSARTSWRNPES